MVETTTTGAVKSEQGGGLFLPPGFRFHPTDEEIITSYLHQKFLNPSFTSLAVGEVDLNNCEPWDLPSKATMGEKEWYFFCHKDMKYPTGMRTNRATKEGYWKATGKDREIFTAINHKQLAINHKQLIGMKKTLVFYMGRAPKGSRTNWVMHEFRVDGKHREDANRRANPKDEWVVCKVFHKKGEAKMANAVEYSAGTPNNGSSVEAGDGGDCFQLDSIIDPGMYLNKSAINVNAAAPYNADYSINSAAPGTTSGSTTTGGFVDLPNYTTTFNTSNGMHVANYSVIPASNTCSNGASWKWNELIPSGSRVVHGMGSYNLHQDDDGHQAAMVKALGGVIPGPSFAMPSSSKGLPSSAMAEISQQNYVGAPQHNLGNYRDPNQLTSDNSLGARLLHY